jgi:general secretion pathway protein G
MQSRRHTSLHSSAGMTLLELMLATMILVILTTAAMPLARWTVQRQREAELHRELREMRDAIDRYKDAADRGLIRVEQDSEGYPPDLETLVKGVQVGANQMGGGSNMGTPVGSNSSTSSSFGSFGGSGSTNTTPSSTANGQQQQQLVRFLRKIPVDPMTGQATWGLRSASDAPDTSSWGGKNVFDVYSLSTGTAMNGTKYADW